MFKHVLRKKRSVEREESFFENDKPMQHSFVPVEKWVMENEKNKQAQQGSAERSVADTQKLRARLGPFSSAAGWLGNAFDRTQLNKREAESRRKRFL